MSIITSSRKMTEREQTAYELGKHDAVRHGRWEEINGYLRCSECKDVYIYEDWIEDGKWKFCPNCGAKMDKEMLESEVSE